MRRFLLHGFLAACLGLSLSPLHGQEWRPAQAPNTPTPRISSDPRIRLGKPIITRDVSSPPVQAQGDGIQPVNLVGLSKPTVIRAQGPGSAEEAYNCGVVSEGAPAGPFVGGGTGGGFGGWVPTLPNGDYFRSYVQRGTFESDHAFDSFASPVSNPIFFEDPRSLTELRPIFIYQRMPGKFRQFVDLSNGMLQNFSGGNIEFFGLQARLAFNERFSFVVNELGGVAFNPDSFGPFGVPGGTSFAELQFGPKFTFYRDDCTNTIAAFGVFFDIAAGEHKAFQDTGDGGVTPYISVGQKLGNFHLLGTFGYRFAFDSARSESFYLSGHVDYSIFDRIYPLIEMNWYHWTSNGQSVAADFEGQDLLMFGSNNVSSNDVLTLAAGVRFKITESIQAGIIYEFPISPRDDLLSWRIGADMIFRY
jgi:hypothetical protein